MPPTDEYIAKSIKAGEQEVEALVQVCGRARETTGRIGHSIGEVSFHRSIEKNRELISFAEQHINVLRSEIREMRRLCKLVDHRRERRENGVYLP